MLPFVATSITLRYLSSAGCPAYRDPFLYLSLLLEVEEEWFVTYRFYFDP